jgi:hypothetical protein
MTDATRMVRTQVYLPRKTYEALQARGEAQGLTLAEQIRTALDDYLLRMGLREDDGPILAPDDPIFQMAGMFKSGVDDLGYNHDHYLYGAPKKPWPDDRKLSEPEPEQISSTAKRPRRKRRTTK